MTGYDLLLTPEEVRRALHLTHFDTVAAQSRMKPIPRATVRPSGRRGDARQGAVLLLLFRRNDLVSFVLTRRREDLAAHAGQISLPGGRREEGESLQETALRETFEEVGIEPQSITILGRLAPIYISPSDFEVHPFVGWREETPAFVPQLSEVAEVIEAPLANILDGSSRGEEVWERGGMSMKVPFFQINSHKVWGATAMMLSEFAERVRSQINGNLAPVR